MIKVEHVSKTFDRPVLKDITFAAEQGDIIGIVGPSGVGKTTLLHIMMGLLVCDTGTLTGLEQDKSAVFQEDRLLERLSILDNMRYIRKDLREETLNQELQIIMPGIDSRERTRDLSGGMKRRVCIVRAMLSDAPLLFMDEPFQGLDRINKERTIQYVLSHRKQRTLFVVSHERTELQMLGVNRIIRLKESGEIEQINDYYGGQSTGHDGVVV